MKTLSKHKWLTSIFFVIYSAAMAQSNMKVTAVYPLSGDGHFDYLAAADNNKLYVSHGNQVNIVDEATGKETGIINGLSGVHGIAFDDVLNKGFISNGLGNNVSVFDLKTNSVTATITTEKNPDGIIYEPFTETIITANGKSHSLSVIDPKAESVIRTIALAGKPEAMASDGNGLLFVNIEDKSEIQQIDLTSYQSIKIISLSPKGEEPSGLAIDIENKLLFSGCANKTLLIIDYTKGTIENNYPIGEDCDAVAYNPGTQTVFSSNGDGTLTVLNREKNTKFWVSTVKTRPGAKTMALNTKTNTVYLSTADFSAQPGANGRKAVIPGTFKILVVK